MTARRFIIRNNIVSSQVSTNTGLACSNLFPRRVPIRAIPVEVEGVEAEADDDGVSEAETVEAEAVESVANKAGAAEDRTTEVRIDKDGRGVSE